MEELGEKIDNGRFIVNHHDVVDKQTTLHYGVGGAIVAIALAMLLNELNEEIIMQDSEIRHCHRIIDTLVANEDVTDYNDLLNRCDKRILYEMGWDV